MERDPDFPSWERRGGKIVWLADNIREIEKHYHPRLGVKTTLVIYAALIVIGVGSALRHYLQ